MSDYKQLSLTDIRARLPKFRRQIHLGLKKIAATHHGQVVGFLVSIEDLREAKGEGLINNVSEVSLSEFRSGLTGSWESLQFELDCIYITASSRRVFAFVSPRLQSSLSIPSADCAWKLFGID
jgi:hypothetical protein